MRPLLYLTLRSVVNGVRRSLTSGRRLISLIFVVGYYYLVFIRPMGSRPGRMPQGISPEFNLPPMEVLGAIVFGFFAVLTLMLALSAGVQRMSFRPADVDVLFATPVSPRLVLVFRLVRDYVGALLIPLLFALLTWRPTTSFLNQLFKDLPGTAGYVGKAVTVAWLLMALAWISIGYGLSMFVNRSDLGSDRNRRFMTYGGIGAFLTLASYIAWRLSLAPSLMAGLVALTEDRFVETAFFTATFATSIVMGPMQGAWGPAILGAGALAVISFLGVSLALSQVGWLYDQAAARGFDTLRARRMQQQGDMMGMIAEQARAGKFKAKRRWLSRIRATGAPALVWREAVIQLRAMPVLILLFAGLGVLFGVMPFLFREEGPGASGAMFLAMQTFSTFMACMGLSQAGYIEMLRRGDLVKPLPFNATVIAFAEIGAKALPAVFAVTIAAVVSVALVPSIWPFAIASLVGLPFVALLFCSAIFLITVLFPDVDDPTQRGFRGLMTLLGLSILTLPVLGVFGLVTLLLGSGGFGSVAAALAAGSVALGLSLVVAYVGGNLYAHYNPSE